MASLHKTVRKGTKGGINTNIYVRISGKDIYVKKKNGDKVNNVALVGRVSGKSKLLREISESNWLPESNIYITQLTTVAELRKFNQLNEVFNLYIDDFDLVWKGKSTRKHLVRQIWEKAKRKIVTFNTMYVNDYSTELESRFQIINLPSTVSVKHDISWIASTLSILAGFPGIATLILWYQLYKTKK